MTRFIIIATTAMLCVLLVVPTVVAQFLPKEEGHEKRNGQAQKVELMADEAGEDESEVEVPVYRTEAQTIERVDLEEYVRGVVASEMPHDFELEALKAQALAARTYIIRRMVERDYSDTPEGSVVTDAVKHQVYQNEDELRRQWGIEFDYRISNINRAVNETIGQIITYEGRPIDATFFSTSNGYTENSEDYWGTEIPYLRSVESPWDEASPRYEQTTQMSVEQFEQLLGIQLSQAAGTDESVQAAISRTDSGRVQEVEIEGHTFSGKEARERLDLDSSDFEWEFEDGQVLIHMNGYGHGVGMSQWGAHGMAEEGHTAEDIVFYYYQDVNIQDYRQWIVRR